ncbi:hypothetical protein [Alienimonas californiensis]|uniref:Uncharacterized protein n=1 Tax=Alienimonas californiensis TaxID=2527989 RepID=A0A517P577_9PLAN|nr:hypothetical protein [Alienimonas californiensis]QDT14505.1 hypothetical protein CA12_05790 [Alienimonas californiensis]
MSGPSRWSRLFRSYTALRVWAIVGIGWTALAAVVAVAVASAALWEHLTRVEYVLPPPGRSSFPQSTMLLDEWITTAPPPGVAVDRGGGGSGGGGGTSRDATPEGAWHTVRLQTETNHAHASYSLRGSADRAALREYFDGPFRDVVAEALAAWEPNVTVTPLDDPAPPPHSALAPGSDADVWGVTYAALRSGSVHEGTVVWFLAPTVPRGVSSGQSPDQSFEFTLEATEERWADR